jgi:hypothetical protein
MGRLFGIEGKWGRLGIVVTPVPEREGGRLQEGDDRWAPLVIGGKERGGNSSGFDLALPWAIFWVGLKGIPGPFYLFILFTPFLFLFSDLFHNSTI